MAFTDAQQKKSYQPIPRFYRPNPRLFVCLSIVLKPLEFSMLLEMIFKMDMDNCFEVDSATVSQYLQARFKLSKDNANMHLRRLVELQLIIFLQGKTRSACRINPIVANRCQFLAGLWEFEALELESEQLRSLYMKWASAKGLDEIHDLPKVLSMKRLNAVVASKRKKTDEEVNETKVLQDKINRMMEEHCQDTENWLKAREDYEMQVQVLKEELRVGREKSEQDRLKFEEEMRLGRKKFDEEIQISREQAEQAEQARQEFQEQLAKSRDELAEVRDILLQLAKRLNLTTEDTKEIKRHLELVRT